jgi:tRNA A37 threonylcarbamoyladenosine synthetase subunit TsaC/SUA5/YrdC
MGRRVPEQGLRPAVLSQWAQPVGATTLILPGEDDPLNDPREIRERLEKQVQAVLDAGACPMEPTTVVDLSGDEPVLVRQGRGDASALGLGL